MAELPYEYLVIPVVGTLEDLVDLMHSLGCLKAFLDHVGREFKLAKSNEVACDEIQDLVIAHNILELEHVLNKIVTIWVLDQEVDPADDDICEG